MKRLRFLLILLVSLVFREDVYAIVNGGINNGDKSYIKHSATHYGGTTNSYGWLGVSYAVSGDSNASSYCIDPGLKSPDVGYEYKRELNLSTTLDQKIYKAYQFYVNNLTAGDDPALTRHYTDVVLRSILNDTGYVTYRHGVTRDNQFFDDNGIIDYIQGKISFENIAWTLGGNTETKSENCNYWVKTTDTTSCKNKFAAAKTYYNSYKNFNITWKNPITITSKVEKTEGTETEEGYYTLKFKVKFTDGRYNFFDFSNFRNGYNMAPYFKYTIGNINDSFSLAGNAIEYSSTSGTITNSNNTLDLFVKISEHTYDYIKEHDPGNDVFIKMNFEYYHPLSHENVYVNSYVNTLSRSTEYQRMVVFGNYIHNDVAIVGKDNLDDERINYNTCKQTADSFYYNGTIVPIEEYKTKCGCPNINSSVITNMTILDKYNSLCGIETNESYTSTMDSCNVDSGNNTLTHNYKKRVEDSNNYCSLECEEKVNISDFTDRYSVLAGRYFELDKYPSLTSSKSCKVKVYYDEWLNDYEALLNDEINSLNKYLLDRSIKNASPTSISCGEVDSAYNYSFKYSYQYREYYYDNSSRSILSRERGPYYFCGDNKPSVKSETENKSVLVTKINKLENHFEELKTCNTYLDDLGSNFYKFQSDLSYYYQQTYSNANIGKRWNNNKPNGEDDDSKFLKKVKNSGDYSSGYKEVTGTTYNSTQYINNSYPYTFISGVSNDVVNISNMLIGSSQSGDYIITRTREFSSDYEPSVIKYVDSYSGKISSDASSLKNPNLIKGQIKNNVYDIHYSAEEKSNNKNYYLFSTLGDNNEIGKYYKEHDENKLKRTCDYEIINNLIKNKKPNVLFRIVDSKKIDPNNRLGTSNGFKNWDNEKGRLVLQDIENKDTYNPDYLEYSFSLDSASIKKIREYNSNCDAGGSCDPIKYSTTENIGSRLSCNDVGNECISEFITELEKDNGIFGRNIATNIDGRNRWKYLIYDSGNWSVEVKNSDVIDGDKFKDLINQYKSLGVDLTP